ncbi:response regulator [Psychrosphaera aestuarii]|uniref:response regulator n=1 Tax=Psychrosphaera aestuarii TaxID=1266052 RepID=UPI001B32BCD0|nr:response regulator [Psychrosphaera aestuarii]
MSEFSTTSFLVVDDVSSVRAFLQQTLSQLGAMEILQASTGEEALARFTENLPDVVFLDIELPDMDGQLILKEMKEMKSNVHVIMVTAHGTVDNVKKSIELGASGFIVKPFSPRKISSVIKTVTKQDN